LFFKLTPPVDSSHRDASEHVFSKLGTLRPGPYFAKNLLFFPLSKTRTIWLYTFAHQTTPFDSSWWADSNALTLKSWNPTPEEFWCLQGTLLRSLWPSDPFFSTPVHFQALAVVALDAPHRGAYEHGQAPSWKYFGGPSRDDLSQKNTIFRVGHQKPTITRRHSRFRPNSKWQIIRTDHVLSNDTIGVVWNRPGGSHESICWTMGLKNGLFFVFQTTDHQYNLLSWNHHPDTEISLKKIHN
jgi:hypothetical protein